MSLPNYQQQLMTAIEKLSKKELQQLVVDISERDMHQDFQLTAQLVPMSLDETVAFLDHAVECILRGQRMLSSEAQETIGKITDALMLRAHVLIEKKQIAMASSIAFAVFLSIEQKMCEVADEGFTFQQIITEAIQFLAELTNQPVDPAQFALLSLTAHGLYSSIPEDQRMYDDDWKKLIELFRKHAASPVIDN